LVIKGGTLQIGDYNVIPNVDSKAILKKGSMFKVAKVSVMAWPTFATLNMLSFIKITFESVLTEGGIILLFCYIPELPRSFLSQKPVY